jgi:hypothetical protein
VGDYDPFFDQAVIDNQVESLPGMVKFEGFEVKLVFVKIERGRDFVGNEFLNLHKDFFNGFDRLILIAENIFNLSSQQFPAVVQRDHISANSDMVKLGDDGKGKLFEIV